MIENTRTSFIQKLPTQTWMDEATQEMAKQKVPNKGLKQCNVYVGKKFKFTIEKIKSLLLLYSKRFQENTMSTRAHRSLRCHWM